MSDLYRYDNGDPIFEEDVKKLSDAQKEEMQAQFRKRINDLKEVFSTLAGERVLIYLMHEMYLFRSYNQHNAGAYALEGKREIANELVDMMGAEFILNRLIGAKNQFINQKKEEIR